MRSPVKARKPFLLRINPDLYREIEAWAQHEMRSVNSQIEFILRNAVSKRLNRHETHEHKGTVNDKRDEIE